MSVAVKFPGSSGNDISSPAISFTGDVEIEFKLAVDSVASTRTVVSNAASSSGGFALSIRTDNKLRLTFWSDTSSGASQQSTAIVVVDEVATYKVTYNFTTDKIRFYKNGVLDVERSPTAAANIAASTDPVYVGSANGTTDPYSGQIYWIVVRDGIDGDVVAKFDAADWIGEAV